jgi:hypothetical protein
MARKNVELSEVQRERFDKCWEIYPRKVEKGEAEIAWHQLDPDEKLTLQIHEAILVQNRERGTKRLSKDDRKFIKHFSSWIRARGWVYELERDGEYASNKKEPRPCKCGGKVCWTNGNEGLCIKCYDNKFHPDFKRKIYDTLCQHNLGKLRTETREEWINRMKKLGRETIAKHFGKKFNNETHN